MYWCTYIESDNTKTKVRYHTLSGLITDILEEYNKTDSEVMSFIVEDNGVETIIINPTSKIS